MSGSFKGQQTSLLRGFGFIGILGLQGPVPRLRVSWYLVNVLGRHMNHCLYSALWLGRNIFLCVLFNGWMHLH